MEQSLEVIVKESGLETTKANYILEKFQDHFKIAAEWEAKAKTIVVTEESQTAEMQMARAGRLFLREKRIAVEKSRKELKEQALREGKAIDGIANVLKALIEPIEDYLDKQEHFVEYKKKAEEEEAQRVAMIKAEEERIAKEKAESEERERIRLENEKLRAEAIEREQEMEQERKKQQAILEAEKAKAEAERKAMEEKTRTEREKAEKERAKVEAELKAKAEAEKKLQEKLDAQIECPKCKHKFNL
jgi:hypothetical protein